MTREMSEPARDKILNKLGCGHFNPPCWLAVKMGFDGLCISFGIPCLIGWIFNNILKI